MEVWKSVTIPGYEELYLVSSLGRVFSKRENKMLKPKLSKAGYQRVSLANKGNIKVISVHRLVALAFITNSENKPTVNHKNEIKTDNRVWNLEWATNAEQNVYGTRIERARKNTDYSARKINYKAVAEKHDYSSQKMCNRKCVKVTKEHKVLGIFNSQREAAAYTNVSPGKVSQCVLGKKKSCKGFEFQEVANGEE
jgi:hypothetical protein